MVLTSEYSLIYNFKETLHQFGNIIYYKSGLSSINYAPIVLFSTWLLVSSYLILEVNYLCNMMATYGYWFILGILSSVGFGTGLQTGVIFVYPKILSTYTYNYSDNLSINTNIINTYMICFPFVCAWSMGTVIGELPPYLIAKTINYKDSKALDRLYHILGDSSDKIKNSIDGTVTKFKKSPKRSFVTITLLSSWPNAMFDICGVAAGLVRLNMYQFLIPTFIGKVCIKTPIQLGMLLYYYGYYGDTLKNKVDIGMFYYIWNILAISFTLYFLKVSVENVVNESIKIT
jgi:hypothetical protein